MQEILTKSERTVQKRQEIISKMYFYFKDLGLSKLNYKKNLFDVSTASPRPQRAGWTWEETFKISWVTIICNQKKIFSQTQTRKTK